MATHPPVDSHAYLNLCAISLGPGGSLGEYTVLYDIQL